MRVSRAGEPKYKHGLSKTPEYQAWKHMVARCTHRDHHAYDRYGGRGITVCDRWVNSPANFLEDMGSRPEGMTLERIDNDGPYSPENCCWADRKAQQSNRRCCKILSVDGQKMTVADWSRATGIGVTTIHHRLNVGWTARQAVTTPPGQARR